MNKNKIVLSSIILAVLLLNICMISAEEYFTSRGQPIAAPESVSPLSAFFFNFQHKFFGNQFSVIGDARVCGDNNQPNDIRYFGGGTEVDIDFDCDGPCLIDLFVSNDNWDYVSAYMEFKDDINFAAVGGTTPRYYIAEIYECPHPQCSEDAECVSWNGAGATCERETCTSWRGGYKCTIDGRTEAGIPYEFGSIRYCTAGSGMDVATCYYRQDNGVCTSREYPGRTDCPATYNGLTLYDSPALCQASPISCSQKNGVLCAANEKCAGADQITGSESGERCCNSASNCYIDLTQCSPGTTECSDGVCRADCGSVNPNDPNTDLVPALSWSKFYSSSDEDFSRAVKHCSSSSQCAPLEGYNVTCKDEDIYTERFYRISADSCDETSGWLDEFADLVGKILPFMPDNFCESVGRGYNSFKDLFTGTKFCVAESKSWYGQLWDSTLKIIGGLGIPAQWVLLSTIGLILLIAVLIISKL